jgi:thioester reductase-like protein
MGYFITGATGFIGKRLVRKLLKRRGSIVYFLVRQESLDRYRNCSTLGAYRRNVRCRSSAI